MSGKLACREYDQLKNADFAITLIVRVTLTVRLTDGPAWVMNLSPTENMSKLTHKAIYDLLAKSAGDIGKETAASR